MKTFKEVRLKGIRNYLIILLTVFGVCDTYGQNERSFMQYFRHEVVPRSTTYDGGLLMTENMYYTKNEINYSRIIKYTLEGKENWTVRLNNIFIKDIIETSDSGFALCGNVNLYPELPFPQDPFVDSIHTVCVLKFDKCARMQWAKYIPSMVTIRAYNLKEWKNGDLIVSTFSSYKYERIRKPITVLKFNKSGKLVKSNSFEGNDLIGQINISDDYMYLMHSAYIPFKDNPDVYYLHTGLKRLNGDLELIDKAYIGYAKKILSNPARFVIDKGKIINVSSAYSLDRDSFSKLLFSEMDMSLKVKGDYEFYADSNYSLGAASVFILGDTTVILCSATNTKERNTSLKLFDKNHKLLKEVEMDMAGTAMPISLVPIEGGNKFLVGVVHSQYTSGALSSIYYFDRHLNPIDFPKTPPARGYDWGCKTNIPQSQIINGNEVVQSVPFQVDTTAPDWDWLLSIREPDPQNIGRISNGWFVWPQPAVAGQGLHLRVNTGVGPQAHSVLQARFYDMQGRQVATISAIPEGEGQWGISSLELPGAGLHLVDLVDTKTGVSVGKLRVMVE